MIKFYAVAKKFNFLSTYKEKIRYSIKEILKCFHAKYVIFFVLKESVYGFVEIEIHIRQFPCLKATF